MAGLRGRQGPFTWTGSARNTPRHIPRSCLVQVLVWIPKACAGPIGDCFRFLDMPNTRHFTEPIVGMCSEGFQAGCDSTADAAGGGGRGRPDPEEQALLCVVFSRPLLPVPGVPDGGSQRAQERLLFRIRAVLPLSRLHLLRATVWNSRGPGAGGVRKQTTHRSA